MNRNNVVVAAKLVKLAKELAAEDDDKIDEAFVAKIRDLRNKLGKISSTKMMKLNKFGIGIIRPSDKVEDLVDALFKVISAQ